MPIRPLVLAAALLGAAAPSLRAQQAPTPTPLRVLAESLLVRLDRGDLEGAAQANADLDAGLRGAKAEAAVQALLTEAAGERGRLDAAAAEVAGGRFGAAEAILDELVAKADARGALADGGYGAKVRHARWWVRNNNRLRASLALLEAEEAGLALDPALAADTPALDAARFAVRAERLRFLAALVEWPVLRGLTAELTAALPAVAPRLGTGSAAVAGALREIDTQAARSTPAAPAVWAALAAALAPAS